ncbi:MAG: 4Fe-4S dicluster domain-containing protein [Candidatus Obscuribacterales bacterium]|jgi:Fe-S-cluster-containing dehydrogenase component|nr:4Fe-4S dicluster domain-containing protein [Candidatus Obscuribacterales bacterium]
MSHFEFFIDPSRCIGCRSCEAACGECETHRGYPMITVDYVDRKNSIATVPTVCMHCDNPTCAQVCPADAIKKTDDGVVQSALKPRCVACSNCVLSCPFGVPKMMSQMEQMMKCDMCYDRTSAGKKPMCATVCPSQALTFVPKEKIAKERREVPTNVFNFGNETVRTKVFMMIPSGFDAISVDVVDYMWEGDESCEPA